MLTVNEDKMYFTASTDVSYTHQRARFRLSCGAVSYKDARLMEAHQIRQSVLGKTIEQALRNTAAISREEQNFKVAEKKSSNIQIVPCNALAKFMTARRSRFYYSQSPTCGDKFPSS
jgi:hypothetical protein